jgi:hypothetical protein
MSAIRTTALLFGTALAVATSAGSACAQAGAEQNAAPNPFRHDVGWLKPPAGRQMGLSINVDIDRDGSSIWVYDRCGLNECVDSKLDAIQKFDRWGKFLLGFGGGMFNHPHGMYVDRDGNVWVTDDHGGDGKGHQVFKFSPDGKVLMTLGKAGVAGNDAGTFNAPTDVETGRSPVSFPSRRWPAKAETVAKALPSMPPAISLSG